MMRKSSRILIVDDNELIRAVLKTLFDYYSIKYDTARNGSEAISKWESEDFSLILMDLDMPDVDGISATNLIRQKEKEKERAYTPIIGISGRDAESGKVICVDAGMDDYVPKPFSMKNIVQAVSKLVGESSETVRSKQV